MLEILSLTYLAVPVLIFVVTWLKPLIGLVFGCLILICYYRFILANRFIDKQTINWKSNQKKLIIILLILLVWVLTSGVGGFVWQNYWDHKFRNAVFMDLVSYKWPVVQGNRALCYYLGFWLPSALVGKIFGLEAGYFFQIIWAYTGVVLSVFLIFKHLGKINIRTVLLLIFFSGLDIFIYYTQGILQGQNLLSHTLPLLSGLHIELQAVYFNSSSNTTLLFWLYNQIIPFWVGFSLILNKKDDNQSLIFIYALLLLFSPFPCVALFPVMLYLFLKNMNITTKDKLIVTFIKKAVTVENISAILFAGTVGLYYVSNIATGKNTILELNTHTVLLFVLYFICEFGLYLLLINHEDRRDPVMLILLVTTVLCSFIVLGNSYDFSWRTCIPLAFYLMLAVAKKLNSFSLKQLSSYLIVVVLLFGAITPCTEITRTIYNEWYVLTEGWGPRSDSLDSAFNEENNECYENFMGNTKSIFFRYFCDSM